MPLLLLCGMLGSTAMAAQEPVLNPRPDSTRNDTLRAMRDTISTTERLLQAQRAQRVVRPVLPLACAVPMQPAGSRVEFSRDSIEWVTAQDVGDLLARVPGVFLHRADWIGNAVLPDYAARGAGSVEYLLDCQPMVALGTDSLAFDPSTTPLNFLDRVEVDLAPGSARVMLFTRRYDRESPRTRIGVAQGDRGVARYFASFERRYSSGIGAALAADYVGVNASEGGGAVTLPSAWLQLGYVPSDRWGIQGQLVTRSIRRDLLIDPEKKDTVLYQVDGLRTDAQLRASIRQQSGPLGGALSAYLATSSWSSDSAPGRQAVTQLGLIGSMRQPLWSAQFSSWHDSRYTDIDSRLDVGWSPRRWVTASGQVVAQRYSGDRRSQWVTGRIGFGLPLGFRVGGVVSQGHRVLTPALLDDPVQRFTDAEVDASYQSRLFGADAGYRSNSGWRPHAFSEFVIVPAYQPMPRTEWVTAHVRITPVNFLTVETFYEQPLRGATPDGTPPNHALSTATLRSRFLHNFPSGIFDLKLQTIMESWSSGVGGLNADSKPILLEGETFFRAAIQLQLGPFQAYYERSNLQVVRRGYVPGYPVQPAGTIYGIRWEFSN